MLTDIEIAAQAKMKRITDVAAAMGIRPEELEPYGHYKAKLSDDLLTRLQDRPDGKLVLVTAVNPTPAGEGKTTVSIGLGQAMCKLGKNAVIALREPSLGPVFGIKGGAAGGGYSQVVPMEDINLHFTGDLHAITSANNLMCALLDNHIQQGNVLGIDPRRVQVKRCMDMNDRALRNIICSLGGTLNGVPREDHFCITVASEVMAILCLAEDLQDLKKRLGDILVAYTYDGAPVYARDIQANGAMTVLLKDAIKPNLVQTLENTPAIMHGGPFANIAHGCNSVRATKTALKLGDYAITEAGFGSDLGAEKFFDIKCRYAGLTPACVVLVSTVQSISDLVNATGLVNSDFADVTEIMKDAGYAHMGVGRAKGKDKAEVAAKQAITSPLLNTSIEGARGVLLNITASTDIGLEEIDAASTIVTNAVHPDCEIIWGANFDEELEDEMIITVIATRFGDEGPNHQIKSTTANLEVAPPVTEPVAPTTAAPSAFTNSDDDAFDQIVDFFKK